MFLVKKGMGNAINFKGSLVLKLGPIHTRFTALGNITPSLQA